MIQKTNNRGQTALVLILLAAGALIFYAITLNWGRIAQEKAMLTIAADQAAAVLASDAASYGEIAKVQYLNDTNEKSSVDLAILLAIIMIVIAVITLVLTWGASGPGAAWLIGMAIAGVVMAVASLVLQVTVIEPGITAMWNKLQKNQPAQQQFYEQGTVTALQGAVTDQISITDYFDSNANGLFGLNASGLSNDTTGISRFAFFYTERLKMLNGVTNVPQVQNFYNALKQFVNGPSWPTGGGPLNDPCLTDSNPGDADYNPYCDSCCQPYYGNADPFFNPNNADPTPEHTSAYQTLRPSSCSAPADLGACPITGCGNPPNPQTGTSCDPYNNGCVPATPLECVKNNPYDALTNTTNYPYLYDSAYQNNYTAGTSFLEQLGRDAQMHPFEQPPPTPPGYAPNWTPEGAFPNGVFPFFWLMTQDSPQVDNIAAPGAYSPQAHWCTSAVAQTSPPPPVSLANLGVTNFPDLTQLSLPSCQGNNCCIEYLPNDLSNPASSNPDVIDVVGDPAVTPNPALDPSFAELNPPDQWILGDNQYCLATWPYNGSSLSLPDGTCELTGAGPASVTPPTSTTSATANLTNGTLDTVDDTGHTLSDFVKFANAFLSQDVGTLTSTFSAWYPEVAEWIAPACSGAAATIPCTTCTDGGSQYATNALTCNDGADGRLLNIYNPYSSPVVDRLQAWTTVLKNWLKASYTGAGSYSPWCEPPQGDPSMSANGQATQENNYISANGGPGAWGDLGHVIACLNYNAGSGAGTSAVGSYQACLTALGQANANGCTALPPQCKPTVLGRSLTVLPEPAFVPSSTSGSSSAGCPVGCPPSDCSSCSTTTDQTSTQCTPTSDPATCPGLGSTTTTTSTTTCCVGTGQTTLSACDTPPDPSMTTTNYPWCASITSQLNASCCPNSSLTCCQPGQSACVEYICNCTTPSCSTSGVCSTPCTNTSTQTAFNSSSCDATVAGSFASWVQNSLTLFQEAQPKFTLRSAFLTDLYTRAENMITIFPQADAALQAFLNGPAANLMAARLSTQATGASLPNAVIYGWIDKPPIAGGGCKDNNGNTTGCAHVVKVTAYSPGRCGAIGSLCNAPASPTSTNIDSTLPWIKTSLKCPVWGIIAGGICFRNYDLRDRDAYVYVKVQRWDQDHSSSMTFPNQLPLWQFSFQNPKTQAAAVSGSNVFANNGCFGLQKLPNSTSSGTGFGLTNQMFTALSQYTLIPGTQGQSVSGPDASALGSAFMLNDDGSGVIDGYAQTYAGSYRQCLSFVNSLLATSIESHACAAYVATDNMDYIKAHHGLSPQSGDNSRNYTIFFEPCPSSTSQMNDMTGGG